MVIYYGSEVKMYIDATIQLVKSSEDLGHPLTSRQNEFIREDLARQILLKHLPAYRRIPEELRGSVDDGEIEERCVSAIRHVRGKTWSLDNLNLDDD